MNDDWLAYKKTPEQRYIIRESSDRYIKRMIWKTLNHVPPSLRLKFYATLPNYIADKVQSRVEEIEKAKRKVKKITSWRKPV